MQQFVGSSVNKFLLDRMLREVQATGSAFLSVHQLQGNFLVAPGKPATDVEILIFLDALDMVQSAKGLAMRNCLLAQEKPERTAGEVAVGKSG